MAYDFKVIENEMLEYWKNNKIVEKIREQNKDKKKYYFLQGPPYTSGKIHTGHAWNNSLKDIVIRYKRMNNLNVWDRAGYDMHGLPTARKVMAKLDLKDKDAVLAHGMDKFSNECLQFSKDTAKIMNDDLIRLGITMDFDNAYMPIDNEYIEGVWFLIKKAHEKQRLYQGKRTMTWCQDCETALAKHECEYKEITDNSIYVKFKVKEKDKIIDSDKDTYFIIWTTTPWTLTFNLAIMVNPDVEYDVIEVDNENWVIAKDLVEDVFKNVLNDEKQYKVVKTLKGSELEGIHYEHIWNDEIQGFKEIKNERLHSVLLSKEYVTTETGTGLVHCAPGCGPEDYEVGRSYGLPPFNTISPQGYFPASMGKFKDLRAKLDDKRFIEALGNALISKKPVKHDYAHCERCHSPIVFRTTKQWFFKIEDLKPRMIDENEKINWIPDSGKNAFRSWLENLRDNSITKQRFWGTPLPIWICDNPECDYYDVIASAKELEEKAIDKSTIPKSFHKPWIDEVKFKCSKCGSEMTRSPDVLDVWLDAGTAAWNCLYYPAKEDYFNDYYPADFICEAKEQVRGWFNMLMFTSLIAFDKPSFKNCYMHGMLTDVSGVKMSKSLGNVISPYEIIDKHGADTLRYYTCQTRSGEDMNFSWDEIAQKFRNLNILWNTHTYLLNNCELFGVNPRELNDMKNNMSLEERYIISRLHNTLKIVTELMEQYRIDESIKHFEDFMIELSRDYIKNTRDKLNSDIEDDRNVVLWTINECLINLVKSFSIICPFVTEKIYLNLRNAFGYEKESVSMYEWPKFDSQFMDDNIEDEYKLVSQVITAILAGRDKIKFGIRWPLKEIIFETLENDEDFCALLSKYGDFIKAQCNVRKLNTLDKFDKINTEISLNFNKLGRAFGENTAEIITVLKQRDLNEVLSKLETDGVYNLNINEKYELTKDHFNISYEAQEPYALASIIEAKYKGKPTKIRVFVDKERNEDLDAEGYAREIARRIQNERKNAKLEKSDAIKLVVEVPEDLLSSVSRYSEFLENRCGADVIAINPVEATEKYDVVSNFKVKGHDMIIRFSKVN